VRRLAGVLVLLTGLALAGLLGAVPAAAHSVLLATSPARGGTVATVPSKVVLTFNEMVRGEFSTIHVTGPDGKRRDDGHLQVLNDFVTEPLAGTRPAGQYVVDWRVVSADGHVVSGQFMFTARSAAPLLVARPANPDPAPAKSSSSTGIVIGVAAGVVVIGGLLAFLFTRRRSGRHESAADE
jgi:methionine-rich copper-binding protein CopC